MNLLTLFTYQSILLVALYRGCQSQNIMMTIGEIGVSTRLWDDIAFSDQLLVKPSRDVDEYTFPFNDELEMMLGGKFTSEDIEITHALDRALEFILMRANSNFTITCRFATNRDLQLFFSELRKTLPLQGSDCVSASKFFQFSPTTVTEIANDDFLYRKIIPQGERVGAALSYNLVRLYSKFDEQTGADILIQEVDLVFLPGEFNITGLIGSDKYGLCVKRNSDNLFFILRLRDRRQALLFFTWLLPDIDARISCSLSTDWVNKRVQYLDSPDPFYLPHLPYLEKHILDSP